MDVRSSMDGPDRRSDFNAKFDDRFTLGDLTKSKLVADGNILTDRHARGSICFDRINAGR